jgi:predicted nucleic acid-binding protein
MLLDTQFLISLEREHAAARVGPARRFLGSHRRRIPFLSVVSMGEFAAGAADTAGAREFLDAFRRVHLFPELAFVAADVDRELIGRGMRLGENDTWLAGTARYYGVPIVSNDDDFDRVRGLRRLSY